MIAELLSFHHRVWVLLGTVTIAAIVNLILEFMTQSREELLPCIYRRRQSKSCDSSESSSVTKEEGSDRSSPNKEPATDCEPSHQDHHSNNSSVGQNPMFILYGGRRPSAMSTWSADSLDGTLPSNSTIATTMNGGMLLQQNGQNPLFVVYNGRRPSTDSMNSYKLNEGVNRFSVCGGDLSRRPSAVSTVSADSLDGTRPLIVSSDSNPDPHQTTPYPPLVITTIPYMSSDIPVRVLSPIHECEDDNEENPAITKASSTSSAAIQRSNSYMAALDDEVSIEYSRC